MSDISKINAELHWAHDEMERMKAENRVALARVARLEAALGRISRKYSGLVHGEYESGYRDGIDWAAEVAAVALEASHD